MSCQGRPPVHHGHTPDPAARRRPVPSAPRSHEPGRRGKCISFTRVHVFLSRWVCRSGRSRPASPVCFTVGPWLTLGTRTWRGLILRPIRVALCLQCGQCLCPVSCIRDTWVSGASPGGVCMSLGTEVPGAPLAEDAQALSLSPLLPHTSPRESTSGMCPVFSVFFTEPP